MKSNNNGYKHLNFLLICLTVVFKHPKYIQYMQIEILINYSGSNAVLCGLTNINNNV